MNVETESLVHEEYFPSSCGSCGRQGTVTSENEVGQLCAPCTTMWTQLSTLALCSCPALWGRHSLSCTLRIRDRTT
jgi:hypothetical protein